MQLEVGSILEGKVTGITKFGAFVELPGGKTGMVHISEVASTYVKEIKDFISENQTVKVKVISIAEDGKVALSIKKAVPVQPRQPQQRYQAPRSQPSQYDFARKNDNMSFEDMMNKFKQSSDEKMSDLKKFMDNKRGSASKKSGSASR